MTKTFKKKFYHNVNMKTIIPQICVPSFNNILYYKNLQKYNFHLLEDIKILIYKMEK